MFWRPMLLGTYVELVQDGLKQNNSHLQLYVLSRAPKTRVQEKLKEISMKSIFVEIVQCKLTNFRLSDLYQYQQL